MILVSTEYLKRQGLVTENVSPDSNMQLDRYAELQIPMDRARELAKILKPALRQLRAMRPAGYEALVPDLNFRVPAPHSRPAGKNESD